MGDLAYRYAEILEKKRQFLRKFLIESVVDVIWPDLQDVCGGYLTPVETSELRSLVGIRQTDRLIDYTKKSPEAFWHFIGVLERHDYSYAAQSLRHHMTRAEAECTRSSQTSPVLLTPPCYYDDTQHSQSQDKESENTGPIHVPRMVVKFEKNNKEPADHRRKSHERKRSVHNEPVTMATQGVQTDKIEDFDEIDKMSLKEEQSHDRHLLISCQLKLKEETIVKKKALEDKNKAIVKLMRLETKYEDLVRENLKLEVQNQKLQAAVAGRSGHTMDFEKEKMEVSTDEEHWLWLKQLLEQKDLPSEGVEDKLRILVEESTKKQKSDNEEPVTMATQGVQTDKIEDFDEIDKEPVTMATQGVQTDKIEDFDEIDKMSVVKVLQEKQEPPPHSLKDAKWEKLRAIPRPSHASVAVYFEGKILILDQQEYSTGIFVFHPRENRWGGVPFDGGRQRTAFAVTVAKGGLHVIGGDWMKGTSRDAFTKDIASLTQMASKPDWQYQHLPPLRNGRADAVAVTIGNHILVIGGIAVELNLLASIEMLDTSSPQRQWVEVGTFPIPSNHLQAAVTEHSIFVGFGNGTENVLYETKISEVENIVATDTVRDAIEWKRCRTAPYKNSGLASYDNNLVSVGGWDSLNRPVVSMFAYDPLRQCWDKLCETLEARKRPSIVPISKEKKLFIFGGCLHSGGGEVCTYT